MSRRKAGQNSGTIYQRADGLWCGSVSLGKHPDGRRNRPSVYGSTAAGVRAKMRELEARHRAGLPTKPDNTTVRVSDIAYSPDGKPALLEITGQIQEHYGNRINESGQGNRAGTERLPPKTKAGTRRLVLPNLASEAIERELTRLQAGEAAGWAEGGDSAGERRELARREGLLFRTGIGTPYIDTDVRRVWYRVLESAGLPRIRPHELRHLCASLLITQGVDIRIVSGLLGHSSATITLGVYSHLLPSTLQAAARGIDAALGGGEGGG